MKKLFYSITLLFLCSCEMDDNGDFHTTWLFWFLIAVFILAFIATAISSESNIKKKNERLQKSGIDPNTIYSIGKYVGGHPKIDKTIEKCSIYKRTEDIVICEVGQDYFPSPKSRIPINSIKNIQVEDATSIEKKITLGRVLLVGVFALAWRKNKKDEHAFVTIDWNDGKFDHSTIFAFDGKLAMQTANTARNCLIKMVH